MKISIKAFQKFFCLHQPTTWETSFAASIDWPLSPILPSLVVFCSPWAITTPGRIIGLGAKMTKTIHRWMLVRKNFLCQSHYNENVVGLEISKWREASTHICSENSHCPSKGVSESSQLRDVSECDKQSNSIKICVTGKRQVFAFLAPYFCPTSKDTYVKCSTCLCARESNCHYLLTGWVYLLTSSSSKASSSQLCNGVIKKGD